MECLNKTIITVALTGSQGTKARNSSTPVTCDEMIEDAYQSYLHGAAIAHFHVKSEDGVTAEINNNKFSYIKKKIREKCDIIVNFSTSGEINQIGGLDFIGTVDAQQEKRVAILNTNPEIATFDIPTMHFNEHIFMNPLPFLRKLGSEMKEGSIRAEVEIFNMGDIDLAEQLIDEDILDKDSLFQLCLGIKGGTPATVKNLLYLRECLPENVNWSAFGVGINHLPILYTTLALGGHIRVGLEDNLYYEKGRKTSNVELVKRAVRIIEEFGNDVATPEEARKILGIKAI